MTGFEHLFLPSHGLGTSFLQHHWLSVVRPPLPIFFCVHWPCHSSFFHQDCIECLLHGKQCGMSWRSRNKSIGSVSPSCFKADGSKRHIIQSDTGVCMCMLSCFSCVWLFVTLWTVAHQIPLIHGILQARILEWVAVPSAGALPDPGIEPLSLMSPALAGVFFTSSTTWEAPGTGNQMVNVIRGGMSFPRRHPGK